MGHPRADIRAAVAAMLKGRTDAGQRVLNAFPPDAYQKSDLPAIYIFPMPSTESAEKFTESPRELKRTIRLGVNARTFGESDDIVDRLDRLADQIERVMEADPYLSEKAADCILSQTATDVKTDGAVLFGDIGLIYDVTYYTIQRENKGAAALSPFEGIDAEIAVEHGTDPEPMPAVVELPQE